MATYDWGGIYWNKIGNRRVKVVFSPGSFNVQAESSPDGCLREQSCNSSRNLIVRGARWERFNSVGIGFSNDSKRNHTR